MVAATKRYVNVDAVAELRYFDAGRCYRPSAILNRPIITKVEWDLLTRDIKATSSHEASKKLAYRR